jgi:hypothetical protein
MPRPSLLNTKPPESSEGPELPLKALSERFEVSLAEFGVLWVLLGVGQCHEDNPSFEGPERTSLMLARRLRRFVRLTLEKPFTLSLIPPPRRVGGLRRLLALVFSKERVDREPPTEEET